MKVDRHIIERQQSNPAWRWSDKLSSQHPRLNPCVLASRNSWFRRLIWRLKLCTSEDLSPRQATSLFAFAAASLLQNWQVSKGTIPATRQYTVSMLCVRTRKLGDQIPFRFQTWSNWMTLEDNLHWLSSSIVHSTATSSLPWIQKKQVPTVNQKNHQAMQLAWWFPLSISQWVCWCWWAPGGLTCPPVKSMLRFVGLMATERTLSAWTSDHRCRGWPSWCPESTWAPNNLHLTKQLWYNDKQRQVDLP